MPHLEVIALFKRLVNEAHLRFRIESAGPLLIRQGNETSLDPTRPDMLFVRTVHPETGRETVYLPGSSLKGVFRARAEQLLRGWPGGVQPPVCDPLNRAASCGGRTPNQENNKLSPPQKRGDESAAERYAQHCPVCRLFGSLKLGSRIAFRDALPVGAEPILGVRNHVAINRFSGGAQGGALFSPEVVNAGHFQAEIRLTNFATWQLALLALILDDLHQGFIGIGGGTTRGYGRVKIAAEAVSVRDYRAAPDKTLCGYRENDMLSIEVHFVRQSFAHQAEVPYESLRTAAGSLDFAAAIQRDGEVQPRASHR